MTLRSTRKHAGVYQDSDSTVLGVGCQLVSSEVVAITSSYGELVLRKSFARERSSGCTIL